MKQPAAYYLLLLYIMVVCKPLMPLVLDTFEHTFNETEHLATVHHQNGMDHVRYEVGKMEKEDNNPTDNPTKPKPSNEMAVHFLTENYFVFDNPISFERRFYFDTRHILMSNFTDIQLPPPKL